MGDNEHRSHAPPSIETAIQECIVSRRNFYLGLWRGPARHSRGIAARLRVQRCRRRL